MSVNNLTSQIINRKSTIGIIGLGYVGLPLAIRFLEEGFRVIGFDVDGKKVQMLNSGESYIKHIGAELIDTAVKNGFKATSDFSHIPRVAAILICVPTPLGVHNEPDLS